MIGPAVRDRPCGWIRWRPYFLSLLVGALALAAIASLNWDLSAILTAGGREQAWERLASFLSAFGAPDLTGPTVEYALALAGQTLSVALLGTLLGAAIGYPLALGAARCVVLGEAEPGGGLRRLLRRAFLEL